MPRIGSAPATSDSDCLSVGLAAAARGGLDAWDLLATASQRFGDLVAVIDTGSVSASFPPSAGEAPAATDGSQQQSPVMGAGIRTYGQLHQRSTALAGFLHRSGVRRGDMVAVMLRNCSQVCVSC